MSDGKKTGARRAKRATEAAGLQPISLNERRKASVIESFERTQRNTVAQSYKNTKIALAAIGARFSLNEFSKEIHASTHGVEGAWDDAHTTVLRDAILKEFAFDPGKQHVADAVESAAIENKFDPVSDKLRALKWDGAKRLDTWAPRLLGAEDTPYSRAVGRLIIRGAVLRALHPGCKFDYIAVLEGKQGCGKSTAIEALAGDPSLFSDSPVLGVDDKARVEALAGRWIVELAELDGMRKGEASNIKAFATRQIDRVRLPYARTVSSLPRRCIMIGTTNESNYLRDRTGNRRFLPLRVTQTDLAGLKAERAQLFAEAVAAGSYDDESPILPRDIQEAATAEQAARLEEIPYQDRLEAFQPAQVTPCGEYWHTTTMEALDSIGVPATRQDDKQLKAAANALRANGWEGPVRKRLNGRSGGLTSVFILKR